jgi:hypothetical protein
MDDAVRLFHPPACSDAGVGLVLEKAYTWQGWLSLVCLPSIRKS